MPRNCDASLPWVKVDDWVLVDCDWFIKRMYRLGRSLNDIILPDARKEGQFQVVYTTDKGLSMRFAQVEHSKHTWARSTPLVAQLSHHSATHPATFSSRAVSR